VRRLLQAHDRLAARPQQVAGLHLSANTASAATPPARTPRAVPAADLHVAVITSLRSSFTAQSLVEHLERQASNTTARAQREAERATLLAELPRLAAAEQRLVRRIATIEDDTLVAALKDEWALAKAARESAERRVTALEDRAGPQR
jgi:hypothetical protein